MVCSIPTPPPLVFLHSPVHPTRCQGGISCASPSRPHTHARTQTKPLVLPMKLSHFSAAPGLSFQSPVRGRQDTIVVASPRQDNRFLRGEEPVSACQGLFPSFLPPRSWDAGGAQREQQVGEIKSWDCFHGNQEFVYCWWVWPWWIYLNALKGINNLRSSWLPRLIAEGCNSHMWSDILMPPCARWIRPYFYHKKRIIMLIAFHKNTTVILKKVQMSYDSQCSFYFGTKACFCQL